MTSRFFPLFALSAAILAACGGPTTVSYRLTFDTQDPVSVDELSRAAIRVAERRLDRMGAQVTDKNVVKDADGTTLTLGVSDSSSAATLTQELTAPFDLQIMEATTDSGADLMVEGFGGFNATGVTGDDLNNILAEVDVETGGGRVRINFTDAGQEKMRAVFGKNVGNTLGLFVRGRLVSALDVKEADLPDPLVIDGIPDAELAQIFADDVNVGLRVTVTPL